MKRAESADVDGSLPIGELQTVLREYPVRLAVLFGSRASGRGCPESDTDVAVEFESVDRESSAYNEVFFGLSADVSEVLATDDVDLVDVETLSPAIARAILRHGVVLVGDPAHAEDLLQRVASAPSDEQSPRERFDAALGRIDEHLGKSPVRASDGTRGKR